MRYLSEDNLGSLFDIIYKHYTRREKVPVFFKEKEGIEKLKGVFEGVKMDRFYPYFYDKAGYLLVQINKGHFFSNGNKRLALVCTIAFALINGYEIQSFSKEQYKAKLAELFSEFRYFQDYPDFFPEEFAFYNLSIMIAEGEQYKVSFDELKARVKKFLEFSLIRISQAKSQRIN